MNKIFAAITLAACATAATPALADHLNIEIDGVWNKGAAVSVPSVLVDKAGFIVIHAVKDGNVVVPASIGHTYIQAGTTKNVEITADYPLDEGEDFIAMLHYDTNDDGVYSFGEGTTDVDTPALTAEGGAYVKPFTGGSDNMGAM